MKQYKRPEIVKMEPEWYRPSLLAFEAKIYGDDYEGKTHSG